MKQRTSNPNTPNYKNYGARGITVCKRWLDSFSDFLADMGPKPSRRHTIERNETDGNYEPDNCYWALPIVQSNNKRNNKVLEFNGERKTATEWARAFKIRPGTLFMRLRKSNWSVERALTTPVK